jgi:copper resistance protein C
LKQAADWPEARATSLARLISAERLASASAWMTQSTPFGSYSGDSGCLTAQGNDVRTLLNTFVCIALAFALGAPTGVAAHSAIEATQPRNGEKIAESSPTIGVRFDGAMRITRFELTGPDGPVVIADRPDGQPAQQFETAPAAPLAPGDYRVEWRALAADGHVMSGEFRFTVLD